MGSMRWRNEPLFHRSQSPVGADEIDIETASIGFLPTVSDHNATDTGLLDANGYTIMRAPNPIGFGKDEEW